MQLIKHAHACVSLVKDGGRIVIDPGTSTPDAPAAVAAAEAVLITHEHFDHFDENLIAQALDARPDLVEDRLYHPGDAYHVPPTPVDTLLVPTSGPWTKLGEAADYVREVAPNRLVQIHEIMLSPTGQQSMARFLSPEGLTGVPLTIVPVGDTITL